LSYSIHLLSTYKHAQRQANVLSTWLKGYDNYVFYTDRATSVGNQVEVDPDDTYNSNGKKNLAELHRVYNERLYENTEWFLFCDDDTCVNLKRLEDLLPTLNKGEMYGSLLAGTWPRDTTLKYLSGGAGYLISSDLIRKLGPPSLKYLDSSFYSDVCVGLWARDNGVESVDVKGFHSQAPNFYSYGDSPLSEFYTFHYIKELSQMQDLIRRYND
jgi:hypothetical protein